VGDGRTAVGDVTTVVEQQKTHLDVVGFEPHALSMLKFGDDAGYAFVDIWRNLSSNSA